MEFTVVNFRPETPRVGLGRMSGQTHAEAERTARGETVTSSASNGVVVRCPENPPELNPTAAQLLFRILRRAEQQRKAAA